MRRVARKSGILKYRPTFIVVLVLSLFALGPITERLCENETNHSLVFAIYCFAMFIVSFCPFYYEPMVRLILRPQYSLNHVRSELSAFAFFWLAFGSFAIYVFVRAGEI